jgi:SAM-dependent methyltransferase
MASDTELANDYWIRRARNFEGPTAVHPDLAWARYHAWTRGLLQRWTFARLAAIAPRFRRAADLGCGFGDWTAQFAEISDEIFACDVAPDFAAATQLRLARHRAARVVCADLRTVELPGEIDLVYVGAALMYLGDDDARAVLARIREAMAPGATVVVRDYCTFNLGRRTVNRNAEAFSIHRTPRDVRRLAERARLRCVEQRSSPSMYGDVMGGVALRWPARALWRLATLSWLRASHTFVLRAD